MRRKRVRATRRYGRFWNRASGHLGAQGQPSPHIGLGKSAKGYTADPAFARRAYVWKNSDGMRKIYTPKGLMNDLGARTKFKGLKAPKGSHRRQNAKFMRKINRERQRDAKAVLLHEFGHVYQRPEVFRDVGTREGGADIYQNMVGPKLIKNYKRHGWGRQHEMDAFTKKWGSKAADRWQFGENWGANPRGIAYSGSGAAGGSRSNPGLRKALRLLRANKTNRARKVFRQAKRRRDHH